MPLRPVPEMLSRAIKEHYAVGYFESWNFESLQAVIGAAEHARSPVIIGFNGEFLSRADRRAHEPLAWYGALGRVAAESASVPCGFIFNECPDDGWVRQAVTAGFNLVMPVPFDGETSDGYQARVCSMVEYAHAHEVAVEAELGKLPFGSSAGGGETTDPKYAAEFVAATGIDLLAISAGNVHVLLHGERGLDIDRIAALREAVDVPLVLHGGTGISADSLQQAIALGVAKVNYGTVLKQRYLVVVQRGLENTQPDPHHLLGYGGDEDVMVAGRLAVKDVVLEKMAILGCNGKAE